MYLHKTPPTQPQNTPFPGLNLKVGKMNYPQKLDSIWAKCLKSGEFFSRSGNFIIIHWTWDVECSQQTSLGQAVFSLASPLSIRCGIACC